MTRWPLPAARPSRSATMLRCSLMSTRTFRSVRCHGRQYATSNLGYLPYWQVGSRMRAEVLKDSRAEFGDGFSRPNLFRMVRFAEVFPDAEIVSTLSRQLGWSHFVEIIPLKEPLKREFYAEMCRVERWSVRTLRDKVQGMLYERTALSKKPEKLAGQELAKLRATDQLTPDLVFRDPYLLDFLGLKDTFSEKDLETAIQVS